MCLMTTLALMMLKRNITWSDIDSNETKPSRLKGTSMNNKTMIFS